MDKTSQTYSTIKALKRHTVSILGKLDKTSGTYSTIKALKRHTVSILGKLDENSGTYSTISVEAAYSKYTKKIGQDFCEL